MRREFRPRFGVARPPVRDRWFSNTRAGRPPGSSRVATVRSVSEGARAW